MKVKLGKLQQNILQGAIQIGPQLRGSHKNRDTRREALVLLSSSNSITPFTSQYYSTFIFNPNPRILRGIDMSFLTRAIDVEASSGTSYRDWYHLLRSGIDGIMPSTPLYSKNSLILNFCPGVRIKTGTTRIPYSYIAPHHKILYPNTGACIKVNVIDPPHSKPGIEPQCQIRI